MPFNADLLRKLVHEWKSKLAADPARSERDRAERVERVLYYRAQTADRIRKMTADEFYEYISKLWAMLIWGNKKYVVDKLIRENGFDELKNNLAEFIWGKKALDQRWDHFRSSVKGMGPAMMSEILCHCHPEECLLWNRRAYVGLNFLGVRGLPRYNYQVTGARYSEMCNVARKISQELQNEGVTGANLLTLDYFIWDELQVEENLSQIGRLDEAAAPESTDEGARTEAPKSEAVREFLHNEVRDKIVDIGTWLGFRADSEIKVADGAVVDSVWEASIGNLGRVIYVFEVQTKGSIDSLIINLLKALNNPAVQGIVAVSDDTQMQRIKKEVAAVPLLREKLKCWNYVDVLQVHEALSSVNESINSLGLVPVSILAA